MKLDAEIVDSGNLTPREREVLCLLCEGNIRNAIAEQLCRSIKTVNRHIESIQRKLHAQRTHDIVARAVAGGYVKITLKTLCLCLFVGSVSDVDSTLLRRARVRGGSRLTARCSVRRCRESV